MNAAGQMQRELVQDGQGVSSRMQGSINLFADIQRGTVVKRRRTQDEPEDDDRDISELIGAAAGPGEGGKDAQFDLGGDDDHDTDQEFEDFMNGITAKAGAASNQDTGILIDPTNITSLNVLERHKVAEDKERRAKIAECK